MRFIKIIFPFILIIIIGFISFNEYKKAKSITNNPLSVIPSHASVIIKINNTDNIFKLFNDKTIWKKLNYFKKISALNSNIKKLNDFYSTYQIDNNNSLYISFLKDGINSNGFLLSSELDQESLLKIKNIFALQNLNTFKYDNIDIYTISNDSLNIFLANVNNIICLSSSRTIVEDAIKSFNSEYNFTNNERFLKIYNTIKNSSDINIMYNLNNLNEAIKTTQLDDVKLLNNLSDWVASDLRINDEKIILNGFNLINYKLSEYADIISNQEPKNINIIKVIPENTNYLFSLGFDNIKKLYLNNNKLLEKNNKIWEIEKFKTKIQKEYKFDYKEFIEQIENEAGIFSCGAINEESEFTYFKSKESIHAYSLLQRIIDTKKSSNYHNNEINYIVDDKLTSNIFGERFNYSNQNFFIVLEDYFIFSKSASKLEYIIDNYISRNTLINNSNFNRFKQNISNKSNVFMYINTVKLFERISSHFMYPLNLDSLNNFTGISYQINNNNSYQINNLSLYYDEDFKQSIKEKWFVQLDTVSEMNPQIIYNHSLKENAIVIQDLANKLYYFTDDEKSRWTLNLKEQIIGDISQGDFFKNNKYQMLFNTSKDIYMLDRYGRNVERFPLKINSQTNIGHSLFDYNNSKRYRILIPSRNNSILNLDAKGKKVIGWKYAESNAINQKLRHFKYNSKDYIISTSSNEINLLAINGSNRVNFSSQSEINSLNNIALDKNGNLFTVTKENKLFICNIDGTKNSISLSSLDSNSLIAYDNIRDEILFSNNENLFTLDKSFNEISDRKFDNKIVNIETFKQYIVVQTKNEIYLLNNGDIVDGTPLKCDGNFTITKLKEDNKINIILTRNRVLYNYQLEEIAQ